MDRLTLVKGTWSVHMYAVGSLLPPPIQAFLAFGSASETPSTVHDRTDVAPKEEEYICVRKLMYQTLLLSNPYYLSIYLYKNVCVGVHSFPAAPQNIDESTRIYILK